MSDMSVDHCGRCRSPVYACACKNGPYGDPRERRLRRAAKRRGYSEEAEWLVIADLRRLYRLGTPLAEINERVKQVCSDLSHSLRLNS
jgi:hypothetical protein